MVDPGQVYKPAPQLHCCFVGGTSELMHARSAICSVFKSFLAHPFMLLIVPYNSVYYNYIIIICSGWLVDSGVKSKKGVCIGKKVHCAPVVHSF